MVDEKLIYPLEVFWAPHHGQKARLIIFEPSKIYPLFNELLSSIRYFRTYGQQDRQC
eukprot:UN20763